MSDITDEDVIEASGARVKFSSVERMLETITEQLVAIRVSNARIEQALERIETRQENAQSAIARKANFQTLPQ